MTEHNLEEIVELNSEDITEEQKTFLEESKSDLTDEQAEKFSIEKESEDEGEGSENEEGDEDEEDEEENSDPEDVEPETRGSQEKPKDDEDEEEEVDTEDEKAIGKVVDKRLSPLKEKIRKQNDEIEVNSYIVDNPEMAKYKPTIIKYLSHYAYKNIPVGNIAAIVSSKDMQKLGAEKERKATEDADKTKDSGRTNRQKKGEVDWANVPKEDVEAQIARSKGMRV